MTALQIEDLHQSEFEPLGFFGKSIWYKAMMVYDLAAAEWQTVLNHHI
jgi:hypothetical protein